ncbi:glycosyltransferase [Massilia sp. W12]|uniref:glycosyltransferase n=1 Tax=Massilia sp. W12 TaxID=3126507 RepID=UPI0030D02CCE
MNYLFIHQNFPGQFVHLSQALAERPGNRVVALAMNKNPAPAKVEVHHYNLLRRPAEQVHPMLQDMESKVLRGEACAAKAMQLKHSGFTPDIIVAHPGWGEPLFLKDVFPRAKVVMYCEFFYGMEGRDVGFDPELPQMTFDKQCILRLKNNANLHALDIADAAISPTEWQKSTYPAWAHNKISVIHDGIRSDRLQPRADARIRLGREGQLQEFGPGAEILTYVARNLEAVRGFHIFMRSLPHILKKRKKARVVVVGGDDVSYGARLPGNLTWREHMLREVGEGIDLSRVHFVGKVPYGTYLDLLQVSKVHAYWTTPFVLSWSFLETAISGAPLIASATQPVLEFAEELGVRTVGFFDHKGFAEAICEELARPPVARQAKFLQRIEHDWCLQRQLDLLAQL